MRKKLNISEDATVFGCISRIDTQKDQMLLLKALRDLKQSGRDVVVVLAGPVTLDSYLDELKEFIKQNDLEDCTRILPPVELESQEHLDLLAGLDAFVLPSRHEPFGIVVLEAWSAGLPVVASRSGGLAKLVDDGRNGLSFDSGDLSGLVARLQQLMDDSSLSQKFVAEGQSDIAQHYTWERVAEKLESIYQSAEAYLAQTKKKRN